MSRLGSFSLLVASVAGLIGLALFPAGSASGSVTAFRADGSLTNEPQSCHRPFDAYAVPKSFLAQCGDHIFPLERIESLPGGGRAYVYDVDGLRAVATIPPKDFNPLTASDRQLAVYHYPPKPSGGHALRLWVSLMSRAHFIAPPRYLVGVVPKVTISVSTNWAGNVAYQCSGCAAYQDVHSTWAEPHYAPTPCPTPVANSNWVGLGGYNTGTLAQDGTAVGEENAGVGSHQAWYELINGNTNIFVPIPGLYATAGQYFYADTDHVPGGYNFFLENQYTGANYSNFVSFNHFDGSTAEMITEDPEGAVANGWDLEKFDPFTVVDAEATRDSATYRGLANFYHYDVVMYDNNDHQMAYAGSANSSGTSWGFNYVNCS